ncbi:MAG: hypothetical protein QE493_00915 [Verrucomicrobiae bacterium]|nr:hypothetical protein [Verrucomicrobiae bacterium]
MDAALNSYFDLYSMCSCSHVLKYVSSLTRSLPLAGGAPLAFAASSSRSV